MPSRASSPAASASPESLTLSSTRRNAAKNPRSYALFTAPATTNGAPSEACASGAAHSVPNGRVT